MRYLPLTELISFKRPSNFYELRTKKRKLSSSFLNKTKYHVRPYYSIRRNKTRHEHDDFTQTLLENKNETNGIFPAQKISKLMYDYLIRINLVSFDVVIPVPNHKQNSEQILQKKNINDPNLEYKIFTTQFDEIIKAENLENSDEAIKLRKNLDQQLVGFQDVITKLANKLQRQLLAKQNRAWEFDLEEGLLDSSKLPRIIMDPYNSLSFKKEKDLDFKDTIVTLLIDNSGSMRGRPITIAAICADILSKTLEKCSV